MSDEKIDHAALIAEARGYQSFAFDAEETGYALIIRALADALEAAQQAPAVDREALVERVEGSALDHFLRSFNGDEAGDIDYVFADDGNTGWAMRGGNDVGSVLLKAFDALIASGILQDAAVLEREAEARGLGEFADWFVNTSSTVGGKPMFTGSEVEEILRGTKPFGMAQQAPGMSREADAQVALHRMTHPATAQQAPAVDREALTREIWRLLDSDDYGGCDCGYVSPRCSPALAVDLIASGILLDAAEVEARGLEKAAEMVWSGSPQGPESEDAVERLRARAQQVREGN